MTITLFLPRAAVLAATLLLGVAGTIRPAAAQCTPVVQLLPADRAAQDSFGYSVAISGDTAVVGAPNKHNASISTLGAVYIFTRTGSGGGTWTQQAELTLPNQAGFGSSVSISGNTLLVGSAGYGSAYVYTRSGTVWTQQASFSLVAASFGDATSLALLPSQRMVALIGAPTETVNGLTGAGAVYVYTLNTLQVGSVWTPVGRFTAADPAMDDGFGSPIGVSGSTAVIGALGNDNVNGMDAGAAYIFTSNSVGGVWTQQAKLIAANGHPGDDMGWGVSVSQDTAIVNIPNGGLSTVFARTGTTWTQQQALPQLGNTYPEPVRIIGDVAVTGNVSVAHGELNLITRPSGSGITGTWSHKAVLRAPQETELGDFFGFRADFSGTTVITGAPNHSGTPALTNSGAAYIFDITIVCPADFDCNGAVTVADIFAFLTTWFAGGFGADFDGNEAVAVPDIFAFLSAWFAGC